MYRKLEEIKTKFLSNYSFHTGKGRRSDTERELKRERAFKVSTFHFTMNTKKFRSMKGIVSQRNENKTHRSE